MEWQRGDEQRLGEDLDKLKLGSIALAAAILALAGCAASSEGPQSKEKSEQDAAQQQLSAGDIDTGK